MIAITKLRKNNWNFEPGIACDGIHRFVISCKLYLWFENCKKLKGDDNEEENFAFW